MYKLTIGAACLYDGYADTYQLVDPILTQEANKAGELTFKVPATHGQYNDVRPLAIIKAYCDETLVFKARVASVKLDYKKTKSVTCEGSLSFLHDSIMRPFDFTGSLQNFLTLIIRTHNEQVHQHQRFELGNVTIVDDYVHYSSTEYMSSWDVIKSRVLDTHGGYLRLRYAADETCIIDYGDTFSDVRTHSVRNGENIINILQGCNTSQTYTAIIPLGAKVESTDDAGNIIESRLTIASVNSGLDYLENTALSAAYGTIFAPVSETTWENVTVATNLLQRGQTYLESVATKLSDTIEIDAAKLYADGLGDTVMQIYDNVQVAAKQHGIEKTFVVYKLVTKLFEPNLAKVSLGATTQSMLVQHNTVKQRLARIEREYLTPDTVSKVLSYKIRDGNATALRQVIADVARQQSLLYAADVKYCGAKGDGVTDDTSAFQAALSSRCVYVPSGTYVISSEIVVGCNCSLELSQGAVLMFTQTSGNCISLSMSASIKGNHATIIVPYAFSGNVINCTTANDASNNVPPYEKWDPMWKTGRYITNLNITKPDSRGFHYSVDGACNGTAVYVSADSSDAVGYMWGVDFSGLRIAGAFAYGIYAKTVGSGWCHEMRVSALIDACEIGVCLEDCRNAYVSATVQPRAALTTANASVPYAKHGIKLIRAANTDLSGSRVWDWNASSTLWSGDTTTGCTYQHIAMIGNCRGLILSDFLFYEMATYDIRNLIYTDTISNLKQLTILQEPFTRWFKPSDDAKPIFYDGQNDKRLLLKDEYDATFQTVPVPTFTDLLAAATDSSSSTFNGKGYQENIRLDVNGTTEITSPYEVSSGYIPCKKGDVIRLGDLSFVDGDDNCRLILFDSAKSKITHVNRSNIINGNYFIGNYDNDDGGCHFTILASGAVAYMRFTVRKSTLGPNPVVTANEDLTYTQVGTLASSIKVDYDQLINVPPGGSVITPTIGDNGNWFIGDADTGKPSRGATGPTGPAGPQGPAGANGSDADVTRDNIVGALGYTPVSPMDYNDRFDGKFIQIAYSYVSGGGATNSKEHYLHCAKNGYDAIKCDVRITSDDKLVLCHDAGYTLNSDGRIVTFDSSNCTPIRSLTYAQVMALEFNTLYNGGRCHPTDLDTFMQICKEYGKIAYITIRDEYMDTVAPLVVSTVKKHGMSIKTIINSFTHSSLTAIRALDSELYLSFVFDPFVESNRTAAYSQATATDNYMLCLYYSTGSHTLEELSGSTDIKTFITNCLDNGIRLCGAQCTDANDIPTLIDLGFSGVQTKLARLASSGGTAELDISDLTVTTESSDSATTLKLTDAKGNEKTASIPKLQPTDAQIAAGVDAWMDDNAAPKQVWSKNVYNPSTASAGYIASAGQINGSADYWVTDFVPASAGDIVRSSKNGSALNSYYRACYNSSKTFISRESGNQNSYTVPDGAVYIRLSFKNSAAASTDNVMVTINNADLTYEAYGYELVGGLGQYLVLTSPNGTKWTLSVSDSGVLSAVSTNQSKT